MASKFELYTALCLFGFKDEVASVSMGYPTSLETFKPHDANIADLETFWIRLAQAISDYPAIGYRIVHSRAFDDFCESYTNVQELVPRMHDFARALDVPGWVEPGNGYRGPLPFHRGETRIWSSLPDSCRSYVLSCGGELLLDDFQYLRDCTLGPESDIFAVLGERKLLVIRNSEDWVGLALQSSKQIRFDGAPQSEWESVVQIPDWQRFGDALAIFIPISAYLQFAYNFYDLPGQGRTMLAGWHPASMVLTVAS